MKLINKSLCIICAALLLFSIIPCFAVSAAEVKQWTFTTGGWSGTNTNGTAGTLTQETDPKDSTNKALRLYTSNGDGYNFELAANDTTKSSAFTFDGDKTYTVSFRYLPEASTNSSANIALYLGSQAAYSSSKPKYMLTSFTIGKVTELGEWTNATYTFTTTETQCYNTYSTSSTNTSVVNRLYFVARGSGCAVYIDDVKITENEATYEKHTISDFDVAPYTNVAKGSSNGSYYVSLRMYTDTESTNRVLGYHYEKDPQIVTDGYTNNGSGLRGYKMGTNGSSFSSCPLTDDEGTQISLTIGKSYRFSMKYKVVDVDEGESVKFRILRGKYSNGWTSTKEISTDASNIFLAVFEASDWETVEFTFTADYTADTSGDIMQLAAAGYGTVLMDDIVVEEINQKDVKPLPNMTGYSYSSNKKLIINEYTGTATAVTVPYVFSGSPLYKVNDYAFLFNLKLLSVTVPEPCEIIGNYAFMKDEALKTVTLPATLTDIGSEIFYGCLALESISVDSKSNSFSTADGVLYNKDKTVLIAYPAAKSGASFTVPSTVTAIADGAFAFAKNLKTVSLPQGLISIGARAFEGSAVESITVPSGVTEIPVAAFKNCTKLSMFSAASVTEYGEHALFGCDALYTVGDLDGSGNIDIADATKTVKAIANGTALSKVQRLAADTNGDGEVDLLDVAILQRKIAGWNGYQDLPTAGRTDKTASTYVSKSSDAELVINLSSSPSNVITSAREIKYDENKEDIIMLLVIGQSNSGTGAGYNSEYSYYTTHDGSPSATPVRPDVGTVYSGKVVTELTDSNDAYYLCDTKDGTEKSSLSGYTPSIGKELYEATGKKVVFIQQAQGATGLHEWEKHPEDYVCTCSNNGGGKLYANAVRGFLKSYLSLSESYNVTVAGYIWNQGEHENVYAKVQTNTIHDEQSYYDGYVEMHNALLFDCGFDFGGIVMPRAWYGHDSRITGTTAEKDTAAHSKAYTVSRSAQYRIAEDLSDVFVICNNTEDINMTLDDPANRIHYNQIQYNRMGVQAAESILSLLDIANDEKPEYIKVYDSIGNELCKFGIDGALISGSNVIVNSTYTDHLYVSIMPLGTHYTFDFTSANADGISDSFGTINYSECSDGFKIIVNPIK